MLWPRIKKLLGREEQLPRRRGAYRPADHGAVPGLILNLKRDETRDGVPKDPTPFETVYSKLMNRPIEKPGRARRGTRRIAKLLGQLTTDKQIKRTGGAVIGPLMLMEAGLSMIVVAFLLAIFLKDLAAFLKL